MVLALAEKYGQSPESVEKWDGYWFNRARTLMIAESMDTERRTKARK